MKLKENLKKNWNYTKFTEFSIILNKIISELRIKMK